MLALLDNIRRGPGGALWHSAAAALSEEEDAIE